MCFGEFTVFIPQIFSEFLIHFTGINQLYFSFSIGWFIVAQNPDVRRDSCVVKNIVRQLNDDIQQIIFDNISPNIAFATACITRKQTRSVVYRSNTASDGIFRSDSFHFIHHFHQKQQLSVTRTGNRIRIFFFAPIVFQFDFKTVVDDVFAVFDVFLFTRPAFSIRRIRKHKVKLCSGKLVGRKRRTYFDVFRVFALNHHIRFTNGIGFIVYLFSKKIHRSIDCLDFAFFIRNKVFRFRKHSTRSAGRIINGNHRWDFIFDWFKNHMRHQIDDFSRRIMLSCFFVIFFIKFPNQFFKNITHSQIGQSRHLSSRRIQFFKWRQIDIRRGKFF